MKPLVVTTRYPMVRVWTLGTFRLERLIALEDERPEYEVLTAADWSKPEKALLLLRVLLCKQQRRAQREALLDALWTQEEQEHLKDIRSAFKVVGMALRSLLRCGNEESLLLSPNASELMLAEQQRLWVDADQFTALVSQAVRATSEQQALPVWEQAHALYQGEFLPEDLYNDWTTAKRETLRGKAGQCIYALTDIYTAQQRLDLAQDLLWNAATAQPRDEDALCRLLSLLERQERYHAAWQLYQDAKHEAIQEEYKLTPRIHAIAKRIREKLISIEPYVSSPIVTPLSTHFAVSDTSKVFKIPFIDDTPSPTRPSIIPIEARNRQQEIVLDTISVPDGVTEKQHISKETDLATDVMQVRRQILRHLLMSGSMILVLSPNVLLSSNVSEWLNVSILEELEKITAGYWRLCTKTGFLIKLQ